MEIQENEALNRKRHPQVWLAYATAAFFVLWNVIAWQFPFFWDNVLNSRIAHWYLESGFERLVPPESLDAGHPPFFSLYIAGLWSAFGKSLLVAHLGMLPFLLATVWAWWRICQNLLPSFYAGWGMLILLVEPTYFAQSSMVSPDVALVCCFLLGVVAILEGHRWLIPLATVLMCMVTFRGILMVPALFLMQWAWSGARWNLPKLLSFVPAFLPSALFAAWWLWHHLQVQGWLFTPPPETYGGHREVMGFGGMLRNIGITGWRFLDYGRIFVWIFLFAAFFIARKRLLQNSRFRKAAVFFLVPTIWLALLLVPFSNPIGHRYFAVAFLALGILSLIAVDIVETKWRRWMVPVLVGIGLLGGHFWVYPDPIAQGWDASLAHLRFFPLQEKFNSELQSLAPPDKEICADFPLLSDPVYSSLEDVQRPPIHAKEDFGWENCGCMVATNVSNGFSDEEWEEMEKEEKWKVVKEWENGPVFIRMLERK